jgi:hypothetical protein
MYWKNPPKSDSFDGITYYNTNNKYQISIDVTVTSCSENNQIFNTTTNDCESCPPYYKLDKKNNKCIACPQNSQYDQNSNSCIPCGSTQILSKKEKHMYSMSNI